MGKKGEGRRPQGADRKTRRLLVHTDVPVDGGHMWTEVHLEVTHGYVQAPEEALPSVREVHQPEVEALGPVSQATSETLAFPAWAAWLDTEAPAPLEEEACSSEEE